MPKRVYYLTWLDPTTGFLKREEFDHHRDLEARLRELRQKGVTHTTQGAFERE